MKTILNILLVLITVAGSCQSSSSDRIDLVGIWTLTDRDNPDKFEDIWEFKIDSVFNELKHKSDGDSSLVPDENGTWTLEGNRLKIIVTGEDFKGEQKLYEKPQTMEFEIAKEESSYILTVIADGGASGGKTTRLRLTKK